MSIKDKLAQSSSNLRREKVTLPRSGVEVQIRELVFGDLDRASYAKPELKNRGLIAAAVEDPETGKPVWDAKDYNDMEAIAALAKEDAEAILEAINRVSGIGEEGKENSAAIENSPSPSPVLSVDRLRNSA
jgi:hypothetical protein